MSDSIEHGQAEHNMQDGAENLFALSLPKGEESFPVLKAFQEFLDAERERARRRQMTLAISFMSALVLLVVLFCVIGAVLFSGMIRRSDSQQDRLFDLLTQRSPAPVQATAPSVSATGESKEASTAELVELLKQLRAENAAMRANLADKSPSASMPTLETTNAGSAVAPTPAPEVKSTPSTKKTGVFSSPKRQPVPAPAAEAAKPAEVPVATEPEVKPPVEAKPVEVKPVEAKPAIEIKPSVEVKPTVKPEPEQPQAWTPIKVKVVPSREMTVPAGNSTEEMTIVSDRNIKIPMRVLMPTGEAEKAAVK